MLNDKGRGEFDNMLEDEFTFDAHPPPETLIGRLPIAPDAGSGSYAEDGNYEVAEDTMADVDNVGSAAMFGPTEIGEYAADGASEIGRLQRASNLAGAYAEGGASEIGQSYAEGGMSEIGDSYAEGGPAEIGAYAEDGMSEIGGYAEDGMSEIGHGQASLEGASEIGIGPYAEDGAFEIGEAVAAVVETARDNRQPPPPMRVVDVDEDPLADGDDPWGVVDSMYNMSEHVGGGENLFPLTTKFMQRAGQGMTPRIVRVDTEESYKKFRQDSSPEIAELRQALAEHINDPNAHSAFDEDISEFALIGAEVEAAEAEKTVDLWMPKHFEGNVTAWREGDNVCASMRMPGGRILTSVEPMENCVEEMAQHAANAGVKIGEVVDALPAMGCVLGAGTVLKEMAKGAPEIAKRPEMKKDVPFMVRLEPKVAPALCALCMLAFACKAGDAQACAEWEALGKTASAPVKQAMKEALALVKSAE